MQIAKRVYSLARDQDDSALMIGAYRTLAVTFYYLGDLESARRYAMRGVQIWRSGGVESPIEEFTAPAVSCLSFEALSQWHFGEIVSYRATMAEAVSLAKELNEMRALAIALWHAGILAHFEGDPAEVERLASDLSELSTRLSFEPFLQRAAVLRGWARSASGNTAEGISWIEDGIRDYRATASILDMPFLLALKAEALHLADRTVEPLEVTREADALVERFENRYWSAELHRLRGVFLATASAEETQIEASFCEAIRIANKQKSVSLQKRAESSYAEYRRRKEERLGHGLPPEQISVARLPVTGSAVFGREEDVAFLNDAWANPHVNVVTIVAWAGVGKSTLVNHWLGQMAAEDYRSAQLVFGWSFYKQGSSGETSSADQFLDAALNWFGDPDPRIGTGWEKGERLAKLVAHRRTLLVLDGLEPLQNPPGPQEGRLREPSLQALLRELAAFNPGLCVITTRLPVADIADHEGSSAPHLDLEHLSREAGAQQLRALGVKGQETELRSASDEFSGHCLALTLLGSYLTDAFNGDIRFCKEVSAPI